MRELYDHEPTPEQVWALIHWRLAHLPEAGSAEPTIMVTASEAEAIIEGFDLLARDAERTDQRLGDVASRLAAHVGLPYSPEYSGPLSTLEAIVDALVEGDHPGTGRAQPAE